MMQFAKRSSGLYVPEPSTCISGRYTGLHLRNGSVIDAFDCKNIVVYQGLDAMLGIMFTGVSQISNWYLALFSGNYVPVGTDTMSTIVSNSTECTAYSSTTRVAFTAIEGSQQATNSASVGVFTFSAGATIYGAFLTSSSGKSSTSGTLFSATQFSSPRTVLSADQLLLTYSVSAASS